MTEDFTGYDEAAAGRVFAALAPVLAAGLPVRRRLVPDKAPQLLAFETRRRTGRGHVSVDTFWRRTAPAVVGSLGPAELAGLVPDWIDEEFAALTDAGIRSGRRTPEISPSTCSG